MERREGVGQWVEPRQTSGSSDREATGTVLVRFGKNKWYKYVRTERKSGA